MIVIGGLGNVWGSITGAIVLTLLAEFIRFFADLPFISEGLRKALTNYNYHLLTYGFLMLICIIFAPNGLVGGFVRLYRYVAWKTLKVRYD